MSDTGQVYMLYAGGAQSAIYGRGALLYAGGVKVYGGGVQLYGRLILVATIHLPGSPTLTCYLGSANTLLGPKFKSIEDPRRYATIRCPPVYIYKHAKSLYEGDNSLKYFTEQNTH